MFRQSSTLREYNRLFTAGSRIFHDFAQSAHLSDAEYNLLYTLADLGEGCCQQDICLVTLLPKQTVHSAVSRLQKDGCVTLAQGQGRQQRICLTEKGNALINNKITPIMEAESAALSAMTEAEQRQLIRLTETFITNLAREKEKLHEQNTAQ